MLGESIPWNEVSMYFFETGLKSKWLTSYPGNSGR